MTKTVHKKEKNIIDQPKLNKFKSKLKVLQHISKRNCALLPYLDDHSLHTLGEFIYNVITQRLKLDSKQLKQVKRVLKKGKKFFSLLVSKKTKNPTSYLRKSLVGDPQVGKGVVSLIGALAPLISSLIFR